MALQILSLRRAAVQDGGDCQDRDYYNGDAHFAGTPCQHLERIRKRGWQQDYSRQSRDYRGYRMG